MEQLPMRRSNAALAVIVAIACLLALTVGYLAYVNHSTISSLKSELSKKDEVIQTQDDLIQQKEAIINENTTKVEEKQKEVEEKSKQVEELEKKISLKLEQEKQKKVQVASLSYSTSTASSQFQDGWKATFYSLGIESTGKRPGDSGYGITASGRAVQNGITIAVDPRQIPLGTWVEIEFPDGHVEKRRADDTGSAIKGRKIDVYIGNGTRAQLNDMGIQQIKIRILKGGSVPV